MEELSTVLATAEHLHPREAFETLTIALEFIDDDTFADHAEQVTLLILRQAAHDATLKLQGNLTALSRLQLLESLRDTLHPK
jgi:hypothetical protein